ncbi:MAG: FAD-binding oxidoreductase [Betaproteobacteria bacterium]|nr:MAG: FAD-binding oxidoreductase [Betaproteobacteria bacterium]
MSAANVRALLPSLDWVSDDKEREKLSKDYYWFSPLLKAALDDKRADEVVRPANREELASLVAACAKTRVPITLRGAGTGNYGQAIPLSGGVVIDLSRLNRVLAIGNGMAQVEAGCKLLDLETVVNAAGFEQRTYPSTFRMATIGGLFGGGFGGVGSINFGPIYTPGNVLSITVLSVTDAPAYVELQGDECLALAHAYGTNGIIVEMKIALAPLQHWNETTASFASFESAMRFGAALAAAPGIIKKQCGVFAPGFTKYMPLLKKHIVADQSYALCLIADSGEAAYRALAAQFDGVVGHWASAREAAERGRYLHEFAWNHTTMHVLRLDKSFTYLQCLLTDPVQQATALHDLLGPRVMMHFEFIRNAEGAIACGGLPVLPFESKAQIDADIATFESNGAYVMNPHVFEVEEGNSRQIDPKQVAAKLRFDPLGLLNPGKLKGWDTRS